MEDKLYIPMGVKPETEFFKGFGKKQMGQAAIGSVICGLIAVILWFTTQNVTVTMIAALTGIAGSVMMTAKDQSNLSVVDQIGNMIRYAKSQKIYPYRYGKEWEVY